MSTFPTHIISQNADSLTPIKFTLVLYSSYSQSFIGTKTTVLKRIWHNVGLDLECDTSTGEMQLNDRSLTIFQSIQGCQDACEADSGCRSITYFMANGMCKRYSTPCTNIKSSLEAISLRFVDSAQSQRQEDASAQSESREIKEHYLRTSAAARRQIDRILAPFSLSFIIFTTTVYLLISSIFN